MDGVACAGASPVEVAYSLGITPTWVDGTMVGGCSFMLHVRHAVAALEAGLCTTVLITHGESGRSRVGGWGGRPNPWFEQFALPYGVQGPPTLFTLPALRWMRTYGITEEEMAKMLVDSIQHASEDMATRAILEARNEANHILLSADKFLEQNQEILTEEEMAATRSLAAALRETSEGTDKDAINQAIQSLNDFTAPLAHRAMDKTIAEAMQGKKV